MEIDARSLRPGEVLEADLCIVGAGPAGISLAHEFVKSNLNVIVIESGGYESDPALQELNQGSQEGDAYNGLQSSRYRKLGGSVSLWNTMVDGRLGGKFVPLDSADLSSRPGGLSDWPFGFDELTPYYIRAQAFVGLGRFDYEAENWQRDLGAAPELNHRLVNRVYQFATVGQLTERYLRAFKKTGNIRLLYHAHAIGFRTRRNGRRVTALIVRTGDGREFQVACGKAALATGAIENARLLLLGADSLNLGKSAAWVGCCFMEHPRDRSMTLLPHQATAGRIAEYFGRRRSQEGVIVGGRIGLSSSALAEGYPNASVSILPPRSAEANKGGILRLLGSRLASSREAAGPNRIVINLEQRPVRENRVTLGTGRDSLGLPRPKLHWQWGEAEQAGLVRLRTGLLDWLGGLGKIVLDSSAALDPNAHHHAGTTRMHDDPGLGVADSSGKVHGMDNLYLAGASVFPTAGWANPTLTIVAMSVRLADHLKRT